MTKKFKKFDQEKEIALDEIVLHPHEILQLDSKTGKITETEQVGNVGLIPRTEIVKLVTQIADVAETIDLFNAALEFMEDPKRLSEDQYSLHYYKVFNLLSVMFQKNQKMIGDLNEVAKVLQASDSEVDLMDLRGQLN